MPTGGARGETSQTGRLDAFACVVLGCRRPDAAVNGWNMSGLIINLASLAGGTSRLEARATAEEIQLPSAQWPGGAEATLQLDRTADLVAVRGRIRAAARLECVRCLRTFDLPVATQLTVVADRAGGRGRLESDLEADDYMTFHDGRQLDLREEAREALLLELPITPHCREDCRGLCPRCGADLNDGPCGCTV